jgi:hypothetical protein
MLHLVVAVLMYADDAALPADCEEDLRLSASIFEDFCNDNRLFIAVPKTYVTIFHNEQDANVKCEDKMFTSTAGVCRSTSTDARLRLRISSNTWGSL